MEILIIGSDCMDSYGIERIKERWGHRISRVETGEEALALVDSKHFDFIVLDLSIPGMEGTVFIPKLKKAGPESLLLTITDSNSRELEREIRREGVIYYMIKPFESIHLEEIIDHISIKLKSDAPPQI